MNRNLNLSNMPEVIADQPEATPTTSFANSLFSEADAARAAKVAANVQGSGNPPQMRDTAPQSPSPTPAKPTPAPQPETKPDTTTPPTDPDEEILTGKRNPKSEDFKRVKEKLKATETEYKGKLSTYETELAELKKAPKHNAKLIEELTQERDKYKTIHDQVLLTQLPTFQKEYADKIAAATAPLKALAPDKAAQLTEALQLPDGQYKRQILGDLISEMDDWTKAEVVTAASKVRDIQSEREARIAKTQETLSTLAEERSKQEKATQEATVKAFEEAVQRIQDPKKGMPIMQLREGEGSEAWNNGVKKKLELARHIYSGNLSAQERADAAFWAASGETLLKELTTSQAEIAQLRETVQRLQGASPRVDAGGAPTKDVPTGDQSRPFTSNFSRWMKEAGR